MTCSTNLMRKVFKRYVGGKGAEKTAGPIHAALGSPSAACIPFAGGLGYTLAKGVRPAVIAESNPWVREVYEAIRDNPTALWADLDSWPEECRGKGEYLELRERYRSKPTPAGLLAMAAFCFNGVIRWNRKGVFNGSPGASANGRPLRRARRDRAHLEEVFAGIEIFDDWRAAILVDRTLPVFADPPYLGTHDYGEGWTAIDLANLAGQLPSGAVICEHRGGLAEGFITRAGFDLVHSWERRGAGVAQQGNARRASEGIWRKR